MSKDDRKIRQLMDELSINALIEKMATEIVDLCQNPKNIVLMGMASRGIPLAKRLAKQIDMLHQISIPVGSLDTTFYRDDFHYRDQLRLPSVRLSGEIPVDIEAKDVVLVDDVLYTGRTVRAALDAITDLGRPASIRLGVLVDRGHREFPICPDFTGKFIQTGGDEEVRVKVKPFDNEDSVWLVSVEEES